MKSQNDCAAHHPSFLLTSLRARVTLALMDRALQFLVESQNSDGGWGYRLRGMSYVEPTAAALLALHESAETIVTNRAHDFLLSLQHSDGGWGIAAIDSESGWMTAWALIALADYAEARDAVARGAAWLVGTFGLQVTDPGLRDGVRKVFHIDSTLRGWPWLPGDAAWVHPTALSILALVAAGKRDEARVRDGIDYLFDRAVSAGGWNIGNPWMIDKPIPSTIQDTAIALRAIKAAGVDDQTRTAPAILGLRDALSRAKTAAELAWGIYALRDWGEETNNWRTLLNSLQSSDGSWNSNPLITAIAMLAQPAD